MLPVRHKNTCHRILADGTKKTYATTKVYIPRTNRRRIDDELRQQIIYDHNYGLAATKIAIKYDVGVSRVRKIIRDMGIFNVAAVANVAAVV